MEKDGTWPERWAVRCTARELTEHNEWMAKEEGKRKPHFPKYETTPEGRRIVTWVEPYEL